LGRGQGKKVKKREVKKVRRLEGWRLEANQSTINNHKSKRRCWKLGKRKEEIG